MQAQSGTRWLLALGLVGPATFWVLGFIVAATWPGYDPVSGSISVMVHAPLGGLQVLAFAIGAPITLGWAFGAGRIIGATPRDRTIVRSVFLLQAAISAAFFLLPTDPPGVPTSFTGALHLDTFYVYALATPISIWLVSRVLGRDPGWRAAARPSLVAAGLMVIATLLVPLTVGGPLEPWLGLLERIYVAIPGVWQAGLSVKALRTVA